MWSAQWAYTVPDVWRSMSQGQYVRPHHAQGYGFREAIPRPLSYVHTPIPQSPHCWSGEWQTLPQPASGSVNHNRTASYATSSSPNGLPSSMQSRGPPMKPKRSGHALWVGNLHPATSIIELKDHFSQGATEDIESVVLIARSTCAFVNYRTEQACRSAQCRFHTSRLHGHALVCRLRRDMGSANGGVLPRPPISGLKDEAGNLAGAEGESTNPVIVATPSNESSTSDTKSILNASSTSNTSSTSNASSTSNTSSTSSTSSTTDPSSTSNASSKVSERFFILKSLTVQDLEDSVRTGTWATQPHNETALNQAYRDSTSVYLVFSVNKSREYFGTARMASEISCTENKPRISIVAPIDRVRQHSRPTWCIQTSATLWAPKGRIVDDTARGNVFWEASISEDAQSLSDATSENENIGDVEGEGRKFQVEWLNITRVPFFRTRGLRNLWNANREVKIARDGTEVEPVLGRQLLGLFQGSPDHAKMFPVYN